jgi:hypothetical protein
MEIVGFRFHGISYRWSDGVWLFQGEEGWIDGVWLCGCFKKKKKKGGAMNE